jgi:hypothetical protein
VSGPAACERDPTRTIYAGGPSTQACQQFNGDPTSCAHAFHRGASGIASCFYDTFDQECRGCGQGNQGTGDCLNTCLHGVVPCTEDPTRTVYTGGPSTASCHHFDGDPVGCATAYKLDECYNATSCYYDADDDLCNGCGPNNFQNGECVNTCNSGPASCDMDSSRIFFAGGPQPALHHCRDGSFAVGSGNNHAVERALRLIESGAEGRDVSETELHPQPFEAEEVVEGIVRGQTKISNAGKFTIYVGDGQSQRQPLSHCTTSQKKIGERRKTREL